MNVSFISLGCDKNRVNTEQMMAMCLQAGMTVQEDVNGSDVVVINTCGFIDSAKTEAIETILSAAELKAAGEVKKILVTGCLSQRYRDEMMTELPEIDGMMGTADYGDIVSAVEQVMAGEDCTHFSDINGAVGGAAPRAVYPHPLCLSPHCRGLLQQLCLLHHPQAAGPLPQPPYGGYPEPRLVPWRRTA